MPPKNPSGGGAAPPGATVGGWMRRFREERGMSLSQLAGKAGLSKSYLSSLENDPTAAAVR